MKLIYIANARIPTQKAHGYAIIKMCSVFAEQKDVDVLLLAPNRFNDLDVDVFEHYGVEKNFKIKYLPCIDLTGKIKKIGFYIQTISFLFVVRIYLFFKKYDVIYTREVFASLFFRNYFLEIHRLPSKDFKIFKYFLKKVKGFIVVTGYMGGKVRDYLKIDNNVLVQPSGIDVKKFDMQCSKKEARKMLDLNQDKKIVSYVGMLSTMGMEKGVDILIQAMKFLDDSYVLMLVGGSDKDIEYYKKYAKKHGVKEKIIFAGMVKSKDIPVYLKASDCLLAPFPDFTHYKYYMSPLKIFEYMASKRPMITSDLSSIREVLNENNAVLIKPNDLNGFVNAIKKVFDNRVFSKKIAQEAFYDVQKYSWNKRSNNICSFIKKNL